MPYNPAIHHRRSIRLRGYDYSRAGAYFVTLNARNRECLFGEVVNGEMRLNETGKMVEWCWTEIPGHFEFATLDAWVVMPNHFHGIVVLTEPVGGRVGAPVAAPVGATHASPLPGLSPTGPSPTSPPAPFPAGSSPLGPSGPKPGSIAAIVGSFKSAVAKYVHRMPQMSGIAVWQRNYHERIIRDGAELDRIRRYIAENPARWEWDSECPKNF